MTVLSLRDADILAIDAAVIHRETGDHGVERTWGRPIGCPVKYYVQLYSDERGYYKLTCARDELEPVVVRFPRLDTAPCEVEVWT